MKDGIFKTLDPSGKEKEYKILTNINIDGKEFLVYTQNVENNKYPDLLINSIQYDKDGNVELGKVTSSEFEKVKNALDEKVGL